MAKKKSHRSAKEIEKKYENDEEDVVKCQAQVRGHQARKKLPQKFKEHNKR